MSYSNYSTYLKYKNCCRPIGDTGPPGPTGPAATIDISGSKGEILYFSETDNLVSTDNVFIQEANITINSNLTANTIHTQRLLFPSGNYIDDNQGVGQLYVNGNTTLAHQVQLLSTLDVSGATTIRSNLSMNNNYINHVSGIIFTQGNLLFSDFSSSIQQVQLPSSQGQPISLERKTLFYDDNFNVNTGGNPIDISFVDATFNQLGLKISGSGNTIILPSPDISGQYVEIYANFFVNSTTSSSKTIALDISGVSSGSSFNETIDVRSITKQGSYYITFGPHIFSPEQWADTSEFVITANTTDTFDINKYKLMFKSYFM
jgi:hypothetical protein